VLPCIVTCLAAPDPASLSRQALALPRTPRLQTPPPCSGGFQSCHVSHGSKPRLPAREGSDAATCLTAPDPVSLLERAPVLLHVTWLWTRLPAREGSNTITCPRLWTPLPCSGGVWCYHVPHDFGPCLPAQGGGAPARAFRIKKGLPANACSKACVFSRHAHALPRRFQDVRADGVIMTCKL
jgi:hypothetical protein